MVWKHCCQPEKQNPGQSGDLALFVVRGSWKKTSPSDTGGPIKFHLPFIAGRTVDACRLLPLWCLSHPARRFNCHRASQPISCFCDDGADIPLAVAHSVAGSTNFGALP
ncbi:hypothetical protein J6590_014972 [Homalodisca vitripennis]|nr:hypothetical protein J6590_014972 [Homalodisca vitripennis]